MEASTDATLSAPSGGQLTTHTISRIRLWALVVIVLFGAVVNFATFHGYEFEDAYITYCYARNLADGSGFVFNEGERVLGTTTPFYTVLLASLAWLGADVPVASGVVFAASLGLVGLLGGLLLYRFGAENSALLFALMVAWGAGRWFWLWGMETPFYVSVLLLTLHFAVRDKKVAVAAGLGVAFLTRYDAALFAFVILGLMWIRDRRIPLRSGMVAATVVAPWLIFAQLYFGSVFPNTLGAKTSAETVTDYMFYSIGRLAKGMFWPVFRYLPEFGFPPILIAIPTLALLGPVFAAARSLFRLELYLWALLLFPVSLWIGYSAIGPPLGHQWYLLPALCFLLLLGLLSWSWILRDFRLEPVASWLTAGLVVVGIVTLPSSAQREYDSLTDNDVYRSRISAYEDIARWIETKPLGDLTILAHEPGFLRFQTGNRFVDAAGLVTEGVYFHDDRRRTDVNELVSQYAPDMIVTPPQFWGGLDTSQFLTLYRAVPLRTLLIRRNSFRLKFSSLADDWLSGSTQGDQLEARSARELHVDFVGGDMEGFTSGGRLWGGWTRLSAPRKPKATDLEPPFLSTFGDLQWGAVATPRFSIDVDEVSIRFAATHRDLTVARLIVDGQEVFRVGGDGTKPATVREVRWPLATWRGKAAVIQFQDSHDGAEYLLADHIRTWDYLQSNVLDDFETGSFGDLWAETFDRGPFDLEALAREHGLAFLVGRFAAASPRVPGHHSMRTHPIILDRKRMSFIALDFGGSSTLIQLRVDGPVVRRWSGRNSRRLQPIFWDVSEFIGRPAVLEIIDHAEAAERWVGIDEIRLFNGRRPATPGRPR